MILSRFGIGWFQYSIVSVLIGFTVVRGSARTATPLFDCASILRSSRTPFPCERRGIPGHGGSGNEKHPNIAIALKCSLVA